jgi:hypothetical protein
VKELQTIYYVLKLYPKNSTNHIFSDNKTTLKYVMRAGGTASYLLRSLALKIQYITIMRNLTMMYNHIPGIKSIQADQSSRRQVPLYEWKMPKKWFKKIDSLAYSKLTLPSVSNV